MSNNNSKETKGILDVEINGVINGNIWALNSGIRRAGETVSWNSVSFVDNGKGLQLVISDPNGNWKNIDKVAEVIAEDFVGSMIFKIDGQPIFEFCSK